jgi:DNA modification methylase
LKGDYNDKESHIKPQIIGWLSELARVLKQGCHVYIYVPTKYIDNWLPEFRRRFKFNNILVCNNMKKGVKYPNLFRNNYQMILYGSNGRPKDFNKIDWILTSDTWFYDKRNKKPSRYIYEYPAYIPPYFKATVEESVGHPDEKNTELIKNLIKISTKKGELVLDCFAGSGSTLVSAKETGRHFIGGDINPVYCSMAEKRLKSIVGEK